MFTQDQAKHEAQRKSEGKPAVEGYDVRVGDTLRAVGVLEEWSWKEGVIRQMVVSPSTGGSIRRSISPSARLQTTYTCTEVVAPEEQYIHAQQVDHLHKTLYSRPFEMPNAKPPAKTSTSLRNPTANSSNVQDVQDAEPPSSPGWHPKSDSTVLTLDDSVSDSRLASPSRSTSWPVLVLGNSVRLTPCL